MHYVRTSIEELYERESIGAFEIGGIAKGAEKINSPSQFFEFFNIESEIYRSRGEFEKMRKCDNRNKRLVDYRGPIYYALLEEYVHDIKFLPIICVEFDERIMTILKTSSESNQEIRVRGFYKGLKDNLKFNPIFTEEIVFDNRVFFRKR